MATWVHVPGPNPATPAAIDIGVGQWGSAWVIEGAPPPTGFLYRRTGLGWVLFAASDDRTLGRVAAAPDGQAWTVNAAQEGGGIHLQDAAFDGPLIGSATVPPVQSRHALDLTQYPSPGPAMDVGVGANFTACILARPPTVPPGATAPVYELDGNTAAWRPVPGGNGSRIAVEPNGTPWIIDAQGNVQRYDGITGWKTLPPVPGGAAVDLGVGPGGHVWVAGGVKLGSGGYQILAWNPVTSTWGPSPAPVTDGAEAIAVSPEGTPWYVSVTHKIYVLQ